MGREMLSKPFVSGLNFLKLRAAGGYDAFFRDVRL